MEYQDSGTESALDVAREGEWALLYENEIYHMVQILPKYKVRLDRVEYDCGNFINVPYGTFFEVSCGQMKHLDVLETRTSALETLKTDEVRGIPRPSGQDNKDLLDENSAQTLSEAEILELKQSVGGGELVKALVNNSATFNQRTEFAQAKYLRKKSGKHQVVVQLLRPTSFLICRLYFNKKPQKILNLREDTLAHIMQSGNLHSGMRVALIDYCVGLILGAVTDRLGGLGRIFHLFRGEVSQPSALQFWNFPPSRTAVIKNIPLAYFSEYLTEEDYMERGIRACSDFGVQRVFKDRKRTSRDASDVASNDAGPADEEKRVKEEIRAETKKELRKASWAEFVACNDDLRSNQADTLIIVGPTYPKSALDLLWCTLKAGGYFVVYSEYMQTLMECYHKLHQCGEAVNIRLNETWYRHYQVLPRSSHPKNNTSSTGGYLLSGIKVQQLEKP